MNIENEITDYFEQLSSEDIHSIGIVFQSFNSIRENSGITPKTAWALMNKLRPLLHFSLDTIITSPR